jgi:DNA repair exonuclease SbcCD ATPase subunit
LHLLGQPNALSRSSLDAELQTAETALRVAAGRHVFGEDSSQLRALQQRVLQLQQQLKSQFGVNWAPPGASQVPYHGASQRQPFAEPPAASPPPYQGADLPLTLQTPAPVVTAGPPSYNFVTSPTPAAPAGFSTAVAIPSPGGGQAAASPQWHLPPSPPAPAQGDGPPQYEPPALLPEQHQRMQQMRAKQQAQLAQVEQRQKAAAELELQKAQSAHTALEQQQAMLLQRQQQVQQKAQQLQQQEERGRQLAQQRQQQEAAQQAQQMQQQMQHQQQVLLRQQQEPAAPAQYAQPPAPVLPAGPQIQLTVTSGDTAECSFPSGIQQLTVSGTPSPLRCLALALAMY